jgi:hypothetical protein
MSNYLSRQLAGYHRVHHHRANLAVHILTVPVFVVGTVVLAYAAVTGHGWLALAGAAAMVAAIGVQGRTHRLESETVAPFRGPLDVIARLFAEQWVTFPRYVASGGFARAWRAAGIPTAESRIRSNS